MRGHMKRVGGRRRYSGIAAGRSQSIRGELRVVIAVDQIMSDPWMLRFKPQDLVEQDCRFLLFSIGLVHRSGCQRTCIQSQRIKDGRLAIGRVSLIKLLHRSLVSAGACTMGDLSPVFVERRKRVYVIPLTLGLCTNPLRFLDFKGSLLQFAGVSWSPKLVIETHSDSPMSHRALRIATRNLPKRAFRFSVLKRM